jgi:hypothetical protein
MNDDALDPRDELASAHLDGDTSPDEAATVAGDQALADRVEAFAHVRDAVRAAGGPVDDARRESAIAAALAAYDEADEAGSGVTRLADRRRPTPRWLPAVGVAAAALLLALLVPLLTGGDGDDEDTTALGERATTSAAPTQRAFEDSSAAEAAPDAAAGGEAGDTALMAALDLADLGEQPDLDALVAAVRERLAAPPTSLPGAAPPAPSDDAQACFAKLVESADGAGEAIALQVTAVVDGTPVVAVVRVGSDGAQTLAVVAVGGCTPVGIVPL